VDSITLCGIHPPGVRGEPGGGPGEVPRPGAL